MYLIDTNIIIHYLEGEHAVVSFLRGNRGELAISSITWMETLSYPFNPDEELLVRAFLREFKMIEISPQVMELSVEIRRMKKMKLPDAIIAASAIHHNLILVSRNIKDFKGVSVKTCDPLLLDRQIDV